MTHTRRWLAAAAVLAAFILGIWGIVSGLAGGAVAHAAAPLPTIAGDTPAQTTQGAARRESGVFSHNGAPITGPASTYRPLDVPNFGANVRANTDTQSPNLAQQEPSIAVNPTNPLNVVAAAKDEQRR